MSLEEIINEDRRLVILQLLEQAQDFVLNEAVLERALAHVGVLPAGRDIVRGHLAWLEQNSLLTLDRLPLDGGRQLWVAHGTKLGTEVAKGRPFPGVARPSAPG